MKNWNPRAEEYVTCAVCGGTLKRRRASTVCYGGHFYSAHRECDFQAFQMKKSEYLGGTVFTLRFHGKEGKR